MDGVDDIKALVTRRVFPAFIHDVSVNLGEYEGDPAVWLTFLTDSPAGMDVPALMERGEALARFRQDVFVDLMEHSVRPYPFFRFEDTSTRS